MRKRHLKKKRLQALQRKYPHTVFCAGDYDYFGDYDVDCLMPGYRDCCDCYAADLHFREYPPIRVPLKKLRRRTTPSQSPYGKLKCISEAPPIRYPRKELKCIIWFILNSQKKMKGKL